MFYTQLKSLCEREGVKPTPLIRSLGFSAGNIKRWENGATVNSDILIAVAEHFKVSVDYLLGRDEKYIGCNNVSTGDIKDNHDVNINSNNNGQKETVGEIEQEVSSILSSLTTREKTELMGVIYKYVDEHIKAG